MTTSSSSWIPSKIRQTAFPLGLMLPAHNGTAWCTREEKLTWAGITNGGQKWKTTRTSGCSKQQFLSSPSVIRKELHDGASTSAALILRQPKNQAGRQYPVSFQRLLWPIPAYWCGISRHHRSDQTFPLYPTRWAAWSAIIKMMNPMFMNSTLAQMQRSLWHPHWI